MMQNKIGVSIVICCYNSKSRLPTTLKHLAQQKTNPNVVHEIILVDNNSEDGTIETAKKIWNSLDTTIPFKTFLERKQGLSYARSLGINRACYEFILFCDDDNWLADNYLQTAFDLLQSDKQIGALGGEGIEVCEVKPPKWFSYCKNYYAVGKQRSDSGVIEEYCNGLYGAGLIIRKSAYQKLKSKNFDFILKDRSGKQVITGGDIELCLMIRAIGYKIYYSDQLIFKHFIPIEKLNQSFCKILIRNWGKALFPLSAYCHAFKKKPRNLLFYLLWCGKIIIVKMPFIMYKLLFCGHTKKGNEAISHWNFYLQVLSSPNKYFQMRSQIQKILNHF